MKQYEISKYQLSDNRSKDLVDRDTRDYFVYKRDPNKLVRFNDNHPMHKPEGFFYQLLHRKVHFRDEAKLISRNNPTGSYLFECQLRSDPDRPGLRILHDEEDINRYIEEYCERHMYR